MMNPKFNAVLTATQANAVPHPLIPTHVGVLAHQEQTLVNARDLHRFLESRQDFSDWIKKRINEYGFIQGADYLIHKFMERENQSLSGWKTPTDYHLSLDMAKELSMVEKTDKGRMVRRYFIELERMASSQEQSATLQLAAMRQMMLEANPVWARLIRMLKAELVTHEMARALCLSQSTVEKHLRQMRTCGLIEKRKPVRAGFAGQMVQQLNLLEG